MLKICLQSGHWNVTTGATGAPGEQELNTRIMLHLKDILIAKGFQLYLVDAYPPDDQIAQDFNLFLALHGDANIYGTGGGFVDYPAPEADMVNAESKRIKEAIESVYFAETGIVNHPERSNANTKYYYMWSRLTAHTPCNIIEMGVVQDAHDKVILADTERVAVALAKGICKAFNVQWETTTTTLPPPTTSTTLPPVTTTTLPPEPSSNYKLALQTIKGIVYGKGWWWTRIYKIRDVLATMPEV